MWVPEREMRLLRDEIDFWRRKYETLERKNEKILDSILMTRGQVAPFAEFGPLEPVPDKPNEQEWLDRLTRQAEEDLAAAARASEPGN